MSQPLRFKPVNPAHEMIYSPDGGWVSWEDYARLKAEVERLDTLCKQLMAQHSDISCENIMLRKAGDEMASTLKDGGIIVSGYALADEWLKAKLLAAKENPPHA